MDTRHEPFSASAEATNAARPSFAREYWDARYSEADRMWSGKPNAALVEEVEGLTPGSALDLGCGEGGDAIWLARRGWQVTAVDVSGVALRRAAAHAEDAKVVGRITFERHDFAESFPAGAYDLVSAAFLHAHTGLARDDVLRAAVAAVAPGGVLLVLSHSGEGHWEGEHVVLPTPQETLAALQLPDTGWEVLVCDEHVAHQVLPDGGHGPRANNTVKVRRTT
ncbi:class I SAM-dependent methyltransferase [Pseudonocardia sp. TRM90224]|uniref:class I SAM-dependent methyltransferase n=1 Tax=Pseudonocardia sp. TRM90224 TaxID=2812678 RepID=UPI001E56B250|nr:class I SAM-dependent methyltransferase [Pseudonocardia sp. TRM90224]